MFVNSFFVPSYIYLCIIIFILTVTLTLNRLDQILNSDFTEQEIREFEEQWQVPVLRIANVTGKRLGDGRSLDGRSGVMVGDFSGVFCSVFWSGERRWSLVFFAM